MREVRKGSQTIADFCVSEVREVGARRLDAPTREVARCEKCEKEVKPSLTFVCLGGSRLDAPTREVGEMREVRKGSQTIADFRGLSESKNSTLW
jgi:hypothetical protein